MSQRNWHYTVSRTQFGPVSEEEIIQMLRSGRLKGDALVWTEGQANWAPVSSVAAFASHVPAVVSAPPSLPPFPATGAEYGRVQAFQSAVAPQAAQYAGAFTYAGFWKRFAASFLDGLICMAVNLLVDFLIKQAAGGDNLDGNEQMGLLVVNIFVNTFVGWLYFAIQEASEAQATLGKRALGIIVVDLNGGRIGFGKATGRYVGKILSSLIFGIGLLMAGFTGRKQALHDMMADCLVVNR